MFLSGLCRCWSAWWHGKRDHGFLRPAVSVAPRHQSVWVILLSHRWLNRGNKSPNSPRRQLQLWALVHLFCIWVQMMVKKVAVKQKWNSAGQGELRLALTWIVCSTYCSCIVCNNMALTKVIAEVREQRNVAWENQAWKLFAGRPHLKCE